VLDCLIKTFYSSFEFLNNSELSFIDQGILLQLSFVFVFLMDLKEMLHLEGSTTEVTPERTAIWVEGFIVSFRIVSVGKSQSTFIAFEDFSGS
jgi:hypothetical protein